ncbi:unnamed protein product [Bursaphelenchus xylophilus]|uniref:Clathrin light chain n=1 Tax=Bursaphelenchus xylophilus TaxID=6326 RepID=A0A1I7RRY1_BURXY|nr:unnamed protein product [Bursaphelenchus xylophilus]CAG9123396.1 unnamed protein product [Bursaphelenchus xylophilus]
MSDDPVAEFLAREDGALDEELNNVVAAPVVNGFQPNGIQDSHEDSGVDLVGQAGDISPPAVLQPTNGRGASPASSVHSSSNHSHYLTSQEEPESIKKWREKHLKSIKEKDELEEKQKNELREQAKKELEAWHKQKEVEIADRKKQNRIAEEKLSKNLVESQSNGQGWAEIAKLIDTGKPAKNAVDTTRMRALILEHKEETVA